jgi:NAD(P)-dependent dehydrogenase (short-subunit alcohol dehydrogenase family)
LTSIPGGGVDGLDDVQAGATVGTALLRGGRIDVLVNNAGRGLPSAVRKPATPATCRSVRITRMRRRAHEHRYSG